MSPRCDRYVTTMITMCAYYHPAAIPQAGYSRILVRENCVVLFYFHETEFANPWLETCRAVANWSKDVAWPLSLSSLSFSIILDFFYSPLFSSLSSLLLFSLFFPFIARSEPIAGMAEIRLALGSPDFGPRPQDTSLEKAPVDL